jgi:hypothetical protein
MPMSPDISGGNSSDSLTYVGVQLVVRAMSYQSSLSSKAMLSVPSMVLRRSTQRG